jgi:hypothetical protein
MGCDNSKDSVYESSPWIVKWRVQFEALGLSEHDVTCLYNTFWIIAHGTQTVEISAMLKFFNFEDSNVMRRAFSVLSSEHCAPLDFRDYVFVLWNFQTLGSCGIGMILPVIITDCSPCCVGLFLLELYDFDSNGSLSKEEGYVMLAELYGEKFAKNKHAKK